MIDMDKLMVDLREYGAECERSAPCRDSFHHNACTYLMDVHNIQGDMIPEWLCYTVSGWMRDNDWYQ